MKILLIVLVFTELITYALPFNYVESEFTPFVDIYTKKLEQLCKADKYYHPIQKSIVFGDICLKNKNSPCDIGMCMWSFGNSYTIYIDRQYWKRLNYDEKSSLIFHELTHCAFHDSEHSKDEDNYMFPELTYITLEDLNKQVDIYIKKRCHE